MSLTVHRCYDTDILGYLDNQIFPEDDPITPSMDMWWVASWNGLECGYAGLSYEGELIRGGVRKEYRGRGIHQRMIQVRIREARRQRLQNVHTYTSLDNIKSMRSLVKAGFLPTKIKYGFIYFSREL